MPRNPHIEAVLRDRYIGPRGRRKVPKPIRQAEPRALERSYLRDIIGLLRPARELVEQLLIPRLGDFDTELSIIDSVARLPEPWRTRQTRADAYPEIIEQVFGDIRLRYGQIVTEGLTRGLASDQAVQLDLFNKTQTARQFKRLLGIDVFAQTPELTTKISAFTTDNVGLIESISERYFREIEQTALRNLRAGNRAETWRDELSRRYDVSESRAALIARDQTNKFNGELNRARQQDLGIDGYIWRTSEDERVRPECRADSGEHYSWTDPAHQSADGLDPGQRVQCRCQAEPDVDAVLDRLGV